MRNMVNTEGAPIFKRLVVKVFFPGNKKSKVFQKVAPSKTGYNEDAIQKMLEQMAANVEKTWPTHEYRLVTISPNQFNFVWEAEREPRVANPFGGGDATQEEISS
jgi:rubrerythrin